MIAASVFGRRVTRFCQSYAGAYYHRPASPGDEGKWVIQLMGGGWCINGLDCAGRAAKYPDIMSTAALIVRYPTSLIHFCMLHTSGSW